MLENWISFRYRSFYDIPRMVVFQDGDGFYLLSCPFDEGVDDYSDNYVLYKLPDGLRGRIDAISDWKEIEASGERIGIIPVVRFEFDATSRKDFKLRD